MKGKGAGMEEDFVGSLWFKSSLEILEEPYWTCCYKWNIILRWSFLSLKLSQTLGSAGQWDLGGRVWLRKGWLRAFVGVK